MNDDRAGLDALRRHVMAVAETFGWDQATLSRHLRTLAGPETEPAVPPPAAERIVEAPSLLERREDLDDPKELMAGEHLPELEFPDVDDELEEDDLISAFMAEHGAGEVDESLEGLTELPAEAPEDKKPAVRRHPRFELNQPVSLSFGNRAELKEMWIRDISKGGLFVETREPPALETILVVELETPDGCIRLNAKVVHVMAPDQADPMNVPAGIGLEFTNLDERNRRALEDYVDGVEARLAPAQRNTASAEVEDARRFLSALQEQDIYAAAQIPPTSSAELLSKRLEQLEAAFAARTEVPHEQTRLTAARRAISRFRTEVFSSPARWLAYDFMRGHTRADERIAEGVDCNAARNVWARVFPEKTKSAASHWARARQAATEGKYDLAMKEVELVVDGDPFNVRARAARNSWANLGKARRLIEEDLAVDELLAWASKNQVSHEDLRQLWYAIYPERVTVASTHAQRALDAVKVQDLGQAASAGREALALDPFNGELREAVAGWEKSAGVELYG